MQRGESRMNPSLSTEVAQDHGMVRFVDTLNENVGRAVAWLTFLMVVVTFLVVVLRYAFDIGWIAMQESVTYMHAVVFMLGAAFTFKHQGHVRVDIYYRKYGPRGRAWVNLLGGVFLLLPTMVFIAWVSWDYVVTSWQVMEGSREAGGLPGVFLLKTLILVMPSLLVLQVLAGIARDLLTLRSGNPDTDGKEGEACPLPCRYCCSWLWVWCCCSAIRLPSPWPGSPWSSPPWAPCSMSSIRPSWRPCRTGSTAS